MSPQPLYYRLRLLDQRPGAGNTADVEFTTAGHRVIAVERDPELLQEARSCLFRPTLSGQGLRKLIPSDHPNAEVEVAERLEELEEQDKIVIIHKDHNLN